MGHGIGSDKFRAEAFLLEVRPVLVTDFAAVRAAYIHTDPVGRTGFQLQAGQGIELDMPVITGLGHLRGSAASVTGQFRFGPFILFQDEGVRDGRT